MSVEEDIAKIIVKGISVSTVAKYLMPDGPDNYWYEEMGLSEEQYKRIRKHLIEAKVAKILGGL